LSFEINIDLSSI